MDEQDLIGKLLIVGVTFIDCDGEMLDQFQTYGRIASVDVTHGIAIERPGGRGRFTVPCDLTNIFPAPPGEYRLRCSGEVVVNPDFTTAWTHESGDEEADIEAVKRMGFSGFSFRPL